MVVPFKAVGVHGNKGGVGKSTVAVNLALELKGRGVKVGFLDGDLDSPYAAELMGLHDKVTLRDDRRMVPVEYRGIKAVSFSAWVPDEFVAASMNGAMHERWLTDVVLHTDWGDTELLVCDLPAGSGDEYLTVRRVLGDSLMGFIGVAQPNVVNGLRRVYENAKFQQVRILGVVENMAGAVFGSGSVEQFCKEKGLNFLGSVPLDVRIRERHQAGMPQLPEDLMGPIRAAADAVLGAK